MSDESAGGCCVRIQGQLEIKVGMVIEVSETTNRKALVRHVEQNIDGPIVGLDFRYRRDAADSNAAAHDSLNAAKHQ